MRSYFVKYCVIFCVFSTTKFIFNYFFGDRFNYLEAHLYSLVIFMIILIWNMLHRRDG